MKNYGVDMQGDIKIEGLATLPLFTEADDQRRLIYITSSNKFYIGTESTNEWREVVYATNLNTYLIQNGDQELDGDKIDIDYAESNYVPATTPVTTSVDHLSSHLKGLDVALGSKASSTHAPNHIRGAADPVDGDKLDIDFTPSYYTRTISTQGTPDITDHIENLTSHLNGLDIAMGAYARTKYFCFVPYEADDDTAIFNGTVGFCVPPSMNGMIITTITATTYTAGIGGTLSVQIRKSRAGTDVDVLSTKCTIDSGEYSSTTAATSYVINTSYDQLLTGDLVFCDIDAVHSTTPAQGLSVIVEAKTEV